MNRSICSSLLTAFALLCHSSASAEKKLEVEHMSQPDNQTCLPTSLLMALNFMGKHDKFTSASVQELHRQTQYNRFNVPEIARQYGLYAQPNWHNLGWTRDTVKRDLDEGRPVILGVNQGRAGHFVLAVGYTADDRVILHDPGSASDRAMGGRFSPTRWEDLNWRGGVRLSEKPFPAGNPVSGLALDDYGNGLEKSVDFTVDGGDEKEVSFTILNNGRESWPAGVAFTAVNPATSPTQEMTSPFKGEGWIDAATVYKFENAVEPGTTVTVNFKVTAPDVDETTTILQYFNLREPNGRWFSSDWNSGPGNRQMGVRMIVSEKGRKIPPIAGSETFEDGKLQLDWGVKYGKLQPAPASFPKPPSGSPALQLNTAGKKWDSGWVGDKSWDDYRVEAWIYCELRKEDKVDGWERVGLFMRDNGQHVGDNKDELEIGRSIAMMFDSDDGSLRAGDIFNGTIGDFRPTRYRIEESGWYHFAVEADGNAIWYYLNDELLHVEKNARSILPSGDCGVYYKSIFKTKENNGVVFADFKVSELKIKGKIQQEIEMKSKGWRDVSRGLEEGVPVWPGDPEVKIEKLSDMGKGDDHNLTKFSMVAHVGTHIDAPSHFVKDGANAEEMPLELMTGVARIISISPRARSIDVKHLEDMTFEKGDRIFFKTRMSEGKAGEEWKFEKNYVHLEPSAARFLVDKGVSFVGIDSFSVGGFNKDNAKVHSTLLSNGIWIVENLDLRGISGGNYEYMCLPIKLKGSDGAPARVLIRDF